MGTVSLLLRVHAADLEPEEHEEHTSDLGRLLRAVDGTRLSTVAGDPAPPGGKATGGVLAGGLRITVAASRKALAAVLEVVRTWAAAVTARSVLVEIDGDRLEIKGPTTAQMDQLVAVFVNRHTEVDVRDA
ncbi:hypothetical protein [Actinocrispum wychmicini]|uniref:Uncharacterized protein n=1 Tax=Actinocrispum wychmicini TaxID=1213861 RepID=A0A4R2JYM4_9PSEU|nr:hypothetical protein [Actinocrispum wychmicini]TCO62359.1 hypothetical protein EV192_102497 [Actinocrispum wychmicini]